jgi:hypothetical protein
MVAALLLLAGCRGGPSSIDGEVSYADVSEIRALAEASGFSCDRWDVSEFTDPGDFARQAADCTTTVAFVIYTDPSGVQEALEVQRTLADAVGHDMVNLVGRNWLVHCSEELDRCTRWQPVLGGRLVVIAHEP